MYIIKKTNKPTYEKNGNVQQGPALVISINLILKNTKQTSERIDNFIYPFEYSKTSISQNSVSYF